MSYQPTLRNNPYCRAPHRICLRFIPSSSCIIAHDSHTNLLTFALFLHILLSPLHYTAAIHAVNQRHVEDEDMRKKREKEWEDSQAVSSQCLEWCKREGLLVLPAVDTDPLIPTQVLEQCKRLLKPLLEDRKM